MYICKYEILAHFNLAVAKVDRQTAKFNSPPNFPAIRYSLTIGTCVHVHVSSAVNVIHPMIKIASRYSYAITKVRIIAAGDEVLVYQYS